MPTYRYKGYKGDSDTVSGTLDADSTRAARDQLRQNGILVSEISEELQNGHDNVTNRFRRRISVADISLFTRRLATLAASSVPLHEALTALHSQERNKELKLVLGRVKARLAEGASLARAMGEEPAVFKENYIAMVAAGEAGGALDRVLLRLADFLERQEALRRTISAAMAYPILMSIVGSAVMLFLLAFVIPKITGIFADSKATLPFITVALLAVSSALRKGWWLLILAGVAAVFAYNRLRFKPSFISARDTRILCLPIIGPLLQTLYLSRFSSILALLLGSGVPLLRSLEISSDAVVNRAYMAVLKESKALVSEGGTLSSALGGSALFPPMLVHMISVGEKSGNLEECLETAGQSFEREFESSATRLVTLLEPVMILAMGVVVGLVVAAVLLPIFQLNQLIK